MIALVKKYEIERNSITKSILQLSIAAKFDYNDVLEMTYNERKILLEVLQENSDAQDPKKQQLL